MSSNYNSHVDKYDVAYDSNYKNQKSNLVTGRMEK
jgi:hypothetical protein